jgi:hypothetical protein
MLIPQQAMLLQVLSLTPEQIDALPPNERAAILQLVCRRIYGSIRIDVNHQRSQFMSST